MTALPMSALMAQHTGGNDARGPWRRSYDVDDARAQVATVCWTPSDKHANFFRFRDVYRDTVLEYAGHIRKPGRTLPISANATLVLRALMSKMDAKTGRCDPCLDTIAKASRLSRRTVVRQLEILRAGRLVNWVRRTVKTGNARGEGPQRQQTSNAYFIDLSALPVDLLRSLRQKLGDKLREVTKVLQGSGPVPNRMAIKAERMLKGLATAWNGNGQGEKAARRALAGASSNAITSHMYGDDGDARREHAEMLGISNCPSASAKLALYPGSRTIEGKD